MADQDTQTSDKPIVTSSINAAGDPGVTPGSAEGDEETIDESIKEKEKQDT